MLLSTIIFIAVPAFMFIAGAFVIFYGFIGAFFPSLIYKSQASLKVNSKKIKIEGNVTPPMISRSLSLLFGLAGLMMCIVTGVLILAFLK